MPRLNDRNTLTIVINREIWADLRHYSYSQGTILVRLISSIIRNDLKNPSPLTVTTQDIPEGQVLTTSIKIPHALWAEAKKATIDRNTTLTNLLYRAMLTFHQSIKENSTNQE